LSRTLAQRGENSTIGNWRSILRWYAAKKGAFASSAAHRRARSSGPATAAFRASFSPGSSISTPGFASRFQNQRRVARARGGQQHGQAARSGHQLPDALAANGDLESHAAPEEQIEEKHIPISRSAGQA